MKLMIIDAGFGESPVPGALPARPQHPVGDLVTTDALHRLDVQRLIKLGRGFGGRAARDGAVGLGEVGIGNTTVAAGLAAVLLQLDPSEVAPRGRRRH